MYLKINRSFIFLLIALVAGSSCKKFLDVNTNPNSPTEAPINGLLTRTTQSTALNVQRVGNITSYYVQYLASPNPASPTDIYEAIDASTTWSFLYDNMTDIHDMEQLAISRGATQYAGVAKILMAMNLHLVHDLWGAAPYSDAFVGDVLTPSYDSAEEIYEACIRLLNEGMAEVAQAGSTITLNATADLIHKGAVDNWVRTAHALKARLLNRVSETPQYSAANVLTEVGLAYTANAQEAAVSTFSVRNPWNQAAVNNAALLLDGWVSEQFVQNMTGVLNGVVDPRILRIADTTRFGDFRGTQNGKGRVGSGTNREETYISQTGYYSSMMSPLHIITFEEVKFIEAEAALRSNNRPRAYAAYLAGITANMNKLGVATAARDAYIAHAAVSVGEANLTLSHIFEEKYKALYLHPETWNDARRFDYAYRGFKLPLNAVLPTFIRRLEYPSVEISRNSANVPNDISVDQRLWWDK